MPRDAPAPATMAGLYEVLVPLVNQAVAAALQRQAETDAGQNWRVSHGQVVAIDGASATVEDAGDPGHEVYATRVGGGPPDEGDSCLILYGPSGEPWALGVVEPPA